MISYRLKSITKITSVILVIVLGMVFASCSGGNKTEMSTYDEAIIDEIKTTTIQESTVTSTTEIQTTTEEITEKIIVEETIEEIVYEQVEEVEEEYEQTEEEYEGYEVSEQDYYNNELYSASDFMNSGVIYWGGWKWTYYSENILPGYGLVIPGRHNDENGYVCDENDYICLASSVLNKGTVIDTPFGKSGKIYDCGCASDTVDVYVGW